MNVEKEIEIINKQLSVLIKNVSKDKKYTGYDIEAGRVNTSKAQRSADDANELSRENETCIMDVAEIASENDGAILDVAEIASENDSAIMELAEYIAMLEERIEKLESEVNA